MNIRKLIRLILKIPATPLVLGYFSFLYISFQTVRLLEWIYEEDDFGKQITQNLLNNVKTSFKAWFTKI